MSSPPRSTAPPPTTTVTVQAQPPRTPVHTNPNLTDLSLADLPFALVLWLYLLLVRALMFVLFAPVLTRAAYGLSLADMVVLSCGNPNGYGS